MERREVNRFVHKLKTYRHLLPKQTIKTLRGQAMAGNVVAAEKGLLTALRKAETMSMAHRQTKIIKKYHEVDYKGQFQISQPEAHRLKKQ